MHHNWRGFQPSPPHELLGRGIHILMQENFASAAQWTVVRLYGNAEELSLHVTVGRPGM